jgi:AraC family transcriptional regulator, ethanolamine operon transcriptional activator
MREVIADCIVFALPESYPICAFAQFGLRFGQVRIGDRGSKKVPMSKSQNNPVTEIFPAGYAFRKSLASYEELQSEAALWNLHPRQTASGRYKGALEACHTRRTQVALADHSCGTRMEGMVPRGTLVFCFAFPSPASIQFRGMRVGPWDMFVHDSSAGLDFSFSGPIRILSVAVDKELFEQRAARLWQADPSTTVARSAVFHHRRATQNARGRLQDCLRQGMQSPGKLAEPVASGEFEERMIDIILEEVGGPRPPEPAPARWMIARRAESYLKEHCREEVRVSDLCHAVGASRRTLHLGFLELYGMGPMAYLRALRLDGVRRELRASGRFRRTITNAATSWGFTHLGRFAADYGAQFGNLPSEEIRS